MSLESSVHRRAFMREAGLLVACSLLFASEHSEPAHGLQELPSYVEIVMDRYEQSSSYYCAPACVQMVLGYLWYPNEPPSQDSIAEELYTRTEAERYRLIQSYLQRVGYPKTWVMDNPRIDAIKEELWKGHPAILDGKYSLKYPENLHVVVAKGYDDLQQGSLIVHDPGDGGPNRHIDYGEVKSKWYKGIVVPYTGARGTIPELSLMDVSLASSLSVALVATVLQKRASQARQEASDDH